MLKPPASMMAPMTPPMTPPMTQVHEPITLNPPASMRALASSAAPVTNETYDQKAPVDMEADSLEHDDKTGTVTAKGSVELTQSGRRLTADEVSYNTQSGAVAARGRVMLTDPNGDRHFADDVALSNDMADGTVTGLRSYLANGGQFSAVRGEREGANLLTLHEASYTACDCNTNAGGDPAWRIKAKKIVHDDAEHRITYRNAQFEIFGTPVLWLPYLAHGDGQIKRKSGLLTPTAGYDSELGLTVANNYYWAIAPDRDTTIGMMLTTQEAPVALAQYRQRWTKGELELNGSLTHSSRTDSIAGENVATGGEWRGHMFAEGRWDMTDKWRSGVNVEVASDDQYLRQYDFYNKDVLESEVYAERFSGRDYAVIRGLAFQDVRVREEQTDQPHILPEAILSLKGEPNATLGGRWEVNASTLGLLREGAGQDVARGVAQAGWQRRDTTGFGLVNTIDLSVRGDAYSVNDRDVAFNASGRSTSGTETRVFPQAHMVTSYPFVKPMTRAQLLVEPIAALTFGTNINADDGSIPNEDSQDVQIDATNLFESDRFPGLDRIEDRSRATYGLRSGVYGYNGSHLTGFIGQSYNFDEDDNSFPSGSGLSRQESDVVGSVAAQYADLYGLNYRFQLDSDGLSSQRHEFDGYAHWKRLSLGSRYLFAKGLGGTNIDESREQIEGNLAYYLSDSWRTRLGALYDLGEDPGLRRAVMGIDYFGCCISLSTTAERNLTSDSSGDSGTNIMFRVGLKGIGEYDSPESGYWGGRNIRDESVANWGKD